MENAMINQIQTRSLLPARMERPFILGLDNSGLSIWGCSMEEQWKPVKGFENAYAVSDHGRVASFKRRGNPCDRIMIQGRQGHNKGYRVVELHANGVRGKAIAVHRLVALHFLDKPNGSDCVHHKDWNPSNNHVSNLEWCTPSQNVKYDFDAKVRSNKGERNSNHKLTKREVDFIRLLKSKHPIMKAVHIASFFGVTHTAINDILAFKRWK
jgi:hypothetical protein